MPPFVPIGYCGNGWLEIWLNSMEWDWWPYRNNNHWDARWVPYGNWLADAGCISILLRIHKPQIWPPWGGKDSVLGNTHLLYPY